MEVLLGLFAWRQMWGALACPGSLSIWISDLNQRNRENLQNGNFDARVNQPTVMKAGVRQARVPMQSLDVFEGKP